MSNNKKPNLPAMPFYIGDWKKDPAVQAMTPEDEGIYLRLCLLCWESEKRGYLQINNKPTPVELLARMVHLDNQRLSTWLSLYQNIFSIFGLTDDNIMYSKKQVDILELSEKRKNAGKKGGNPVLKGTKKISLTTSKPIRKPNTITESESEDIKSIVEDFNKVMNSKYRNTTKGTISLIMARLQEGFTVEDFKTVHKKMYKCWSDDEKMSTFLRPSTLYNGDKFEGYLNLIIPGVKW